MDYDVALRLENVENKCNITVKFRGSILKLMVPDPSTSAPIHWIKTSAVKIRPALKNHIYLMN